MCTLVHFLNHPPKWSYFDCFSPTFSKNFPFSALRILMTLPVFSLRLQIVVFWLLHRCKNTLSSLRIFIHHCTFCASLHVRTCPARCPPSYVEFKKNEVTIAPSLWNRLPPSARASLLSSNLSTSLSLLKTCLFFLEVIEPQAPLFAYGCWEALYKYLNTIKIQKKHLIHMAASQG